MIGLQSIIIAFLNAAGCMALKVLFDRLIVIYSIYMCSNKNILKDRPGPFRLALCNCTLHVIVEHYSFAS